MDDVAIALTPTEPTPRRSTERVSPYPQRIRTPTRAPATPSSPGGIAPALPSTSTANDGRATSSRRSLPQDCRYQLLVDPMVKRTLSQKDSTGVMLEAAVYTGASFGEIIEKIWAAYAEHIKCRAVRGADGVWTREEKDAESWMRMLQLKFKNHVVDSSKSEQAWGRFLQANRQETGKLIIYEYGTAIATAADLTAFKRQCVEAPETDRAGAASDRCQRDAVAKLQERWSSRYDADEVVWRMWASDITKRDHSTWDEAINMAPPRHVLRLMSVSNRHLEQHLSSLSRSITIAIDAVDASLEDFAALEQDWEAYGTRLKLCKESLLTRKRVLKGFETSAPPPTRAELHDPLSDMENLQDHEHEDDP